MCREQGNDCPHPCYPILAGDGFNLFFPEFCQVLVRGFEICPTFDFPAYLPLVSLDDHVIAAEVPALPGARGIDGAGKSRTLPVVTQERAGIRDHICWQGKREDVRIFGGDMDREEFVCEPVAAVEIPVRDLSLDLNERPKALAAFSAVIAHECCHGRTRTWALRLINMGC